MADQKAMEEVRKWNADLDAVLQSEGVVDQSLYLQLLDACRYDAATSVGWAEAKIKVLLKRVLQGTEVSLFDPSLRGQKRVLSEPDLRSWIVGNFPGLSV